MLKFKLQKRSDTASKLGHRAQTLSRAYLPTLLPTIIILKSPSMDRLLNVQTALSLGYVASMVLAAHLSSRLLLPADSTLKTRLIFLWLAFDSICHLTLEAPSSTSPFATAPSTLPPPSSGIFGKSMPRQTRGGGLLTRRCRDGVCNGVAGGAVGWVLRLVVESRWEGSGVVLLLGDGAECR